MIVDETIKVYKSNHSQMLSKKVLLKISQHSLENVYAGVCFDKVAGPQLYKKRDSNAGVFL